MTRRAITKRMKIDALLWLEWIECRVCRRVLKPGDRIEWDHDIPLANGGTHTYDNLRPLHYECHKRKTFGTKATTAGSDIHKIAKVKRIAKGKMAVNRTVWNILDRALRRSVRVAAKGKRRFPPGRKLQSRRKERA